MEKIVVYSLSENNEKKYISNISPLLWTNKLSEAKIFRSKGEIKEDLSYHLISLAKLSTEFGLTFHLERLT